ncbi:hypothetical protein CLOM_g11774 [Closterium sp. NIES-68]|nr:hypothetical protein CLOM_g11774 [Closterium sp. NIES-68]
MELGREPAYFSAPGTSAGGGSAYPGGGSAYPQHSIWSDEEDEEDYMADEGDEGDDLPDSKKRKRDRGSNWSLAEALWFAEGLKSHQQMQDSLGENALKWGKVEQGKYLVKWMASGRAPGGAVYHRSAQSCISRHYNTKLLFRKIFRWQRQVQQEQRRRLQMEGRAPPPGDNTLDAVNPGYFWRLSVEEREAIGMPPHFPRELFDHMMEWMPIAVHARQEQERTHQQPQPGQRGNAQQQQQLGQPGQRGQRGSTSQPRAGADGNQTGLWDVGTSNLPGGLPYVPSTTEDPYLVALRDQASLLLGQPGGQAGGAGAGGEGLGGDEAGNPDGLISRLAAATGTGGMGGGRRGSQGDISGAPAAPAGGGGGRRGRGRGRGGGRGGRGRGEALAAGWGSAGAQEDDLMTWRVNDGVLSRLPGASREARGGGALGNDAMVRAAHVIAGALGRSEDALAKRHKQETREREAREKARKAEANQLKTFRNSDLGLKKEKVMLLKRQVEAQERLVALEKRREKREKQQVAAVTGMAQAVGAAAVAVHAVVAATGQLPGLVGLDIEELVKASVEKLKASMVVEEEEEALVGFGGGVGGGGGDGFAEAEDGEEGKDMGGFVGGEGEEVAKEGAADADVLEVTAALEAGQGQEGVSVGGKGEGLEGGEMVGAEGEKVEGEGAEEAGAGEESKDGAGEGVAVSDGADELNVEGGGGDVVKAVKDEQGAEGVKGEKRAEGNKEEGGEENEGEKVVKEGEGEKEEKVAEGEKEKDGEGQMDGHEEGSAGKDADTMDVDGALAGDGANAAAAADANAAAVVAPSAEAGSGAQGTEEQLCMGEKGADAEEEGGEKEAEGGGKQDKGDEAVTGGDALVAEGAGEASAAVTEDDQGGGDQGVEEGREGQGLGEDTEGGVKLAGDAEKEGEGDGAGEGEGEGTQVEGTEGGDGGAAAGEAAVEGGAGAEGGSAAGEAMAVDGAAGSEAAAEGEA